MLYEKWIWVRSASIIVMVMALTFEASASTPHPQSGLVCRHEMHREMTQLHEQGLSISLKYRHGVVTLYNFSSRLEFTDVTRHVFRYLNLASSIVLAAMSNEKQNINIVLVDEMLTESDEPLPTMSQYDEEIPAIVISVDRLFHFAAATKLQFAEAAIMVVALQTHQTFINNTGDGERPPVDSMQIAVKVLKTIFPFKEGSFTIGPSEYSYSNAEPYFGSQ